ncbi:50S ribosomal protein L32 [Ammonifex thiophilus]|uniref:Large ribosomal subunit protein bL32 n=1 Tax=Ammonifex thiophilus TaxID=444093 RepID=A0A3D8P3Y9_9THEO|nr:50S ribosomal protein L32 [Ammonifex thiophilus]RDV83615.1 50S ribosomal protein L32 [Ammonifex thiophilus]
MGVPKSRSSKQRKRLRRMHYKAEAPTLVACPRCKALKRPHAVCSNCGYYKGRQVLAEEQA